MSDDKTQGDGHTRQDGPAPAGGPHFSNLNAAFEQFNQSAGRQPRPPHYGGAGASGVTTPVAGTPDPLYVATLESANKELKHRVAELESEAATLRTADLHLRLGNEHNQQAANYWRNALCECSAERDKLSAAKDLADADYGRLVDTHMAAVKRHQRVRDERDDAIRNAEAAAKSAEELRRALAAERKTAAASQSASDVYLQGMRDAERNAADLAADNKRLKADVVEAARQRDEVLAKAEVPAHPSDVFSWVVGRVQPTRRGGSVSRLRVGGNYMLVIVLPAASGAKAVPLPLDADIPF